MALFHRTTAYVAHALFDYWCRWFGLGPCFHLRETKQVPTRKRNEFVVLGGLHLWDCRVTAVRRVSGLAWISFWLGSLVLLAASLVGELSIKGGRMKGPAIACIVVSAISNAVFAYSFARAAGLGIV